jgi:DHA1 family tetracycline resistance protein-like MFS transporter
VGVAAHLPEAGVTHGLGEPVAPSARGRYRVTTMPPLISASLVVFFEVLSFGAIFPVLPDYCRELGAPAHQVLFWTGVMFALVGGPRIFLNVAWGKLSDHWGRRRVLALLTVGTLSGSILWALAPRLGGFLFGGLVWLALSRLFAGIFQAHATLTQAVAADVSTPEKRAASMGVLGAAFGFGMLGGILLGGLVGHHVSIAAVGWATAAGQAVSLLVILFALRETHPAHAPEAATTADQFERLPIRALLDRPMVKHLLVVILTMTVGQVILIPTLRVVTDRWYGFDLQDSTWAFALWMGIGVLVQGGMIRPTVKAIGERATILFGGACLAAGFFLLAVQPGIGLFWLASVLIALGTGFATPTLTGLLSRNVSAADQGAIQGFNQSATALGRTLSYCIVIAIAAVTPRLQVPFWVAGLLVTASLVLLAARPQVVEQVAEA